MELYKKHRPDSLEKVIGQPQAVAMLAKFEKRGQVPHALLFTGPSGCGKTTFARIVSTLVRCDPNDLVEYNSADFRGIDTIREIRTVMGRKSMRAGGTRVWIMDELHQLRADAQNALLKILEDPEDHAYFMLATTDPAKLIRTIRTRCTEIKVKLLDTSGLSRLLSRVCKKEKIKISDEVRDKIIEVSDGSARKALVVLEQVGFLEDENEQLESIEAADAEKKGIDIARALLGYKTWKHLQPLLRDLEEEPETVRRVILRYANAVLLKSGMKRACDMIEYFATPFFDADTGKALLTATCYQLSMLPRKHR